MKRETIPKKVNKGQSYHDVGERRRDRKQPAKDPLYERLED